MLYHNANKQKFHQFLEKQKGIPFEDALHRYINSIISLLKNNGHSIDSILV